MYQLSSQLSGYSSPLPVPEPVTPSITVLLILTFLNVYRYIFWLAIFGIVLSAGIILLRQARKKQFQLKAFYGLIIAVILLFLITFLLDAFYWYILGTHINVIN